MSGSPLISETEYVAYPDMIWVGGGRFLMGSNAFYPEERPDVIAEEARKLWALAS